MCSQFFRLPCYQVLTTRRQITNFASSQSCSRLVVLVVFFWFLARFLHYFSFFFSWCFAACRVVGSCRFHSFAVWSRPCVPAPTRHESKNSGSIRRFFDRFYEFLVILSVGQSLLCLVVRKTVLPVFRQDKLTLLGFGFNWTLCRRRRGAIIIILHMDPPT